MKKAIDDINAAIDGLKDNTLPVITAESKNITVGDAVDLKAGVSANDDEDGDITSKITVEGTVPADKSGKADKGGSYKITYRVTDNDGTAAEKTVTVKVISNMAKIKVKDGIKSGVVKSIDEPNPDGNTYIKVYKSKETPNGLEPTTYQDMLNEIESADGSEQSYKIEGQVFTPELNDAIGVGYKLMITAEDGKTKQKYTISLENRDRAAPEGLKGINETDTEKGKITGVSKKMEYRIFFSNGTSTSWAAVKGDELTGLSATRYEIRYKEDSKLGLNASPSVTIEIEKEKPALPEEIILEKLDSNIVGDITETDPLKIFVKKGTTVNQLTAALKVKGVSEDNTSEVTMKVKDSATSYDSYKEGTDALASKDMLEVKLSNGVTKSYKIFFIKEEPSAAETPKASSVVSNNSGFRTITFSDTPSTAEYINSIDSIMAVTTNGTTDLTSAKISKTSNTISSTVSGRDVYLKIKTKDGSTNDLYINYQDDIILNISKEKVGTDQFSSEEKYNATKYRIKFNSSDIPEKTVRAIIKSGSKYYLLAKEKSAGGNPYINTTSRRSYVEMIFNSSLTPAAPLDEAILIEQQSGSSKVVYHNIK